MLAFLLVAASCASRKNVVVLEQPQTFEWLTANMDIHAEGKDLKSNDLTGQLRIRKDSLVWLSVTATLGMEVARVKVSIDSVWVINRLDKTYLAEPLDQVSDQLGMPISLPWVQTLLLDNNEGLPPVENQTVLLKNFAIGHYSAKVKYNRIQLNQEASFPLKITNKMERIQLQNKP